MQKIKIIFLLFVIINLTACIEITEEITVNLDQSGKVAFSLNLGTLSSFAQMLGDQMDGSPLDEIKTLPEKGAELLKDITGITDIIPNNKDGLVSLSFNFKNTKTLNSALYKLFHQKKSIFDPGYLTIRKHKLIKKNYGAILRLFVNKYAAKLKDKSFLKMIEYKTVFNFPGEVKKVTNPLSKISDNKKSVEFSCTLEELISTPVNIGNKIKY